MYRLIILLAVFFSLAVSACSSNQVPVQNKSLVSSSKNDLATSSFNRDDFSLTEDYSWACHKSEIVDVISVALTEDHVLIDCAFKNEDLHKMDYGEEPTMEEYYFIVSMGDIFKSHDKKLILKEIKRQVKNNYDDLMARSKSRIDDSMNSMGQVLSVYADTTVTLSNQGSAPLGIIYEDDEAFSHATIETTSIEVEDFKDQYFQVVVSTVFIKDSELIVQYYYLDYRDQNDIKKAKDFVSNWLSQNR